MADMMANHITVRVPDEEGAFLINAYGMMYEEITASSLVKVDHAGTILSKPNWTHRLELACRSQIGAMSCNTPLQPVPQAVLEETWNNYQPGTRRPYGVVEWPALLRKLERLDPSYRD
jgi:ribulose-5-phosphate 4-epimerase/fuculose-1-phosphate aldolase